MLNLLRALLLIALAWPAAAQSGPADQQQAARDLVSNAAQALAERRAAGFLEALDKPLAAQLRKPVEALLQSYDVQPALEFLSATADNRGVALAIDWKLDLTAREGLRGITHREKRVSCRVESRDGALRIVAFGDSPEALPGRPAFSLRPMWTAPGTCSQSAARALSQPDTPAAGFLAAFDSKLPGYEALRNGAEGWQPKARSTRPSVSPATKAPTPRARSKSIGRSKSSTPKPASASCSARRSSPSKSSVEANAGRSSRRPAGFLHEVRNISPQTASQSAVG
jgi:hypothetical protein